MASKDRTSKTARVMNLLSNKKAEAAPEEAAGASAPVSPAPPIVTSMAPDVAVSAQIKNALEDALEGELEAAAASQPAPAPEEAPAPQPAPAPEEAAAPQPEPVQEEPPAPQPEPVWEEPPAPQPEPVQAEAPAPQPENASVQKAAPAEDGQKWSAHALPTYPGYLNVMQLLVEEKAPKYVKMFGLCSCERCMEDVKALTLNHLPSKYVVLEPGDLVPRLTVYENKFSSDITAQMLHACKLVMDHPHHSR